MGKRPDRPSLRISSGWPRAPCGFSELCSSHCTCVEPARLLLESQACWLKKHGKNCKDTNAPTRDLSFKITQILNRRGERYYAVTEGMFEKPLGGGTTHIDKGLRERKAGCQIMSALPGIHAQGWATATPTPLPALGQPQRHANQVWLPQSTQKFEKYRFTHLELSVCRNLKPSFNHRVNPSLPHFQVGRARWVAS